MEKQQTATEWIEDWLKEFPYDKFMIDEMRTHGKKTDEDIKAFLEGT